MTENLWDFDAVQPGQAGPPTVVTLTPQNIAEYAALAQNPDARYRPEGGRSEYGGNLAAMPTMALSYAPLLRAEIAAHNGFVALEQSQTARRQTPFAKCAAQWFRPAFAGDTITAVGRVLEKYERRGSKFVTFRLAAENQRGEPVGQYDYTCIFEYAQGQRATPPETPAASPAPAAPVAPSTPAHTTPSAPLTFAALSIGDTLAELTITESQEIINRKSDFRLAGAPSPSNIHNDPEFARQNIFGGLVNAGPATMSYVDQMLEQSFPLSAFYNGGRLLMRAITPFRAGDSVTFGGEITAKGIEQGQGIVECRVKGINQRGELVCLADAALMMGV